MNQDNGVDRERYTEHAQAPDAERILNVFDGIRPESQRADFKHLEYQPDQRGAAGHEGYRLAVSLSGTQ